MSTSNPTVRRNVKSTYSDLPIQLAERVVSEVEFVDEILNYSRSNVLIEILNQLMQYKENCRCLNEDRYSFNEILKRGAIELSFLENQMVDTVLVGLNSMHFMSGKIVIETTVKLELYIQENKIKLDNHKGLFAILSDGRRNVKARIESVSVEDNIDGGITILVDCLNPYSNGGINNIIQLMVVTSTTLDMKSMDDSSQLKEKSMKQFRESYGRLETLKSDQGNNFSILDHIAKFRLKIAEFMSSCLKQR